MTSKPCNSEAWVVPAVVVFKSKEFQRGSRLLKMGEIASYAIATFVEFLQSAILGIFTSFLR